MKGLVAKSCNHVVRYCSCYWSCALLISALSTGCVRSHPDTAALKRRSSGVSSLECFNCGNECCHISSGETIQNPRDTKGKKLTLVKQLLRLAADPETASDAMWRLADLHSVLRETGQFAAVGRVIQNGLNSPSYLTFQAACALAVALPETACWSVPVLVKSLRSEDPYRASWAVRTLGNLGEGARNAVPALLELISNNAEVTEDDAQSVLAALCQIGIGDRNSAERLNVWLGSEHYVARLLSALILLKFDAEHACAAEELSKLLRHPSEDVRFHALVATESLEVIPQTLAQTLRMLCNDSAPAVRRLAKRMIARCAEAECERSGRDDN